VVQKNHSTLGNLNKNFGGFSRPNLLNYLGSFFVVTMIYFYWFDYYGSSELHEALNIESLAFIDPFLGIISGFILTSLLMMPIWLATFFVYRKTGYQVKYRLDSSRVLITVIFNFLWIFLPGGGPIILRLGDIKTTEERGIRNRSFIKGIAWGSVYTVIVTIFFAIISIGMVGWGTEFTGFFQNVGSLKTHFLTLFFGATFISLILLLPLGDFYDRVLKEWNIVVYFIMLIVIILMFFYSMEVLLLDRPPRLGFSSSIFTFLYAN
jgi:hypothetical protein